MKRFYCTVCQKVKRVQQWPNSVAIGTMSTNPVNRIGECNWHKQGHIRPVKKEYVRPVTIKKTTPEFGRRTRKSA